MSLSIYGYSSIPLSIPNLKRYDDKGKDIHFNVPNLLCMGFIHFKNDNPIFEFIIHLNSFI